MNAMNPYTRTRIVLLFTLAFLLVVAWRVYAAEISNVTITDITPDSATIKWNTDQKTDATVNYGLDTSVGIVRDPTFDKKEHTLKIENLEPLTTYHFRAVSTDGEGNKSATAGFVFTTKGNDADLAKKINTEIKKVKDTKALEEIVAQVKETASDILRPPAILGATRVRAETTEATITWSTDRESNSVVYAVPEGEYNAADKNTYSIVQGDPKESTKKHTVVLIGLDPSTTYHFKATSEDKVGLRGESEDDTFKTKSILPDISNIRVTRVQENSAWVSWSTGNVRAKGVVNYTNTRTKVSKSMGDPVFTTNHSVQLTGLEFGTRYTITIVATNEGGDNVESKQQSFVTVRDVVPPAIAKVNNESTLFPGEDTKIQTIISWQTDEPTTCQVFYTQGLIHAEGDAGDALPPESNPVTTHTQVIVGFAPATVYKFWMTCQDEARNKSQSEDFVLITPIKEKNIIDIILENFQGTFGWVNNIGK